MKNIAILALFVAIVMPATSSAAMLNATPAEVMDVISSEMAYLSSQVSDNGIVAGVNTDTDSGLVMSIDGARALQFTTATEFHVAKELCYLFAVNALVTDDHYTCTFNDTLIFDSATDAV